MPVASESLVIPIGGRQQIEADVYVRDRAIGPVIDERDPEGGYARGRCGAGDRAGRDASVRGARHARTCRANGSFDIYGNLDGGAMPRRPCAHR
jgi:hypothetical protein